MNNKFTKNIFFTLLITLTFNLTAKSQETAEEINPDIEAEEAVEELKAAINNAKDVLDDYPAGQKLLDKIANAKNKLIKTIESITPEQCSSIYSSSITRLEAFIPKISSKGCPETTSRQRAPICIPQDILDEVIPELESALESLKLVGQIDFNRNGIPDFCDNNFDNE